MIKTELIAGLILATTAAASEPPREPATLAVLGNQLLVGNRDSGTICWIDVASERMLDERAVAKSVSQLALWGPGRALILDSVGSQLLLLDNDRRETRKLMQLPSGATRLAADYARGEILVAATWSRSVTVLRADPSGAVTRRARLSLPFAPGELLPLAESGEGPSRWLVADAFGGRLAVIDPAVPKLLTNRQLHGHNIRGLARDRDGDVLVAHQQIAEPARADYEELHWGRLMSNTVQAIDAAALLRPGDDRLAGWRRMHGGIGGAAGDPSAILTGPDLVATAFSGVAEVCVEHHGQVKRLTVGRHPTALARHGEKLFVANRFDDSVSVINLPRLEVAATIQLSAARQDNSEEQLTKEERGQRLFYDATLSHQGWMSCHSCHTDGHTSGLLVDTMGDGDYGAPKRVPSLLGTKGTAPWGWTGGSQTLAAQLRMSVETTMHGRPLSARQASDLTAFLSSLRAPAAAPADALARRGRQAFHSRGCVDCHAPPRFTSSELYDVGTKDERGRTRFNPPSLQGVRLRDRLLHDGRARGLRQLLTKHGHPANQPAGEPLEGEELRALLAYLNTL